MFNVSRNLIPQSVFDAEYKKLYDYQKKSVDCIEKEIAEASDKMAGQVILPTGAGKTRIAEYITGDLMNKIYVAEGRMTLFGVTCHRLSLANNLANRILSTLTNSFGIKNIKIFVCNSGSYSKLDNDLKLVTGFDGNINYCSQLNYGLEENVKSELSNGNHVMFIMLYHSMDKLLNKDLKFDFVFYDEAHITTQTNFYEMLSQFHNKSFINLFFTATPTVLDNGFDMTNEKIYGKQLINVIPKEITLTKHVCPLKMILFDIKNSKDEVIEKQGLFAAPDKVLECIQQGAGSLFEHVKKDSKGTKEGVLFVSVAGNKHLEPLLNRHTDSDRVNRAAQAFFDWRMQNHVDLYVTSSELEGNIDFYDTNHFDHRHEDGTSLNKEEFIAELEKIGTERKNKAIIVNIDQLSEGIDLPNINGVMLFRHLDDNTAKILQIIGRSVRRAEEDRYLILDDSVKFDEAEKFIKPCAYVYIPTCGYSRNETTTLVKLMMQFYPSYGSLIFRMLTRSTSNGIETSLINNPDAKNKLLEEMLNANAKKINWEERLYNLLNNISITEEEKIKYCTEYTSQAEDTNDSEFNRIYTYVMEKKTITMDELYDFITVYKDL